MKMFQKTVAILTIAVFTGVGCAAGPAQATAEETMQQATGQQAAATAITTAALTQMLFWLLVIDYIEKQKKKESSACSKLAPAAVASSDHPGALIMPVGDGETGTAYFDMPWGRELLGYQKMGERYLVGDVVFDEPSAIQAPGGGVSGDPYGPYASVYHPDRQWADRKVYYYYHTSSPADSTMVSAAIAHWETHSSFRFIQTTSGDTSVPKISFATNQGTPPGGCWSYVGRITTTGTQIVNVDNACGVGSTVHEIGHALGLYHEQTRSDRDEHVNIDFSQITSPYESNYQKSGGDSAGPYDFDSIMHYGSYYFASGSDPVMTTKSGGIINPNRTTLTDCDVNGANLSNPL